MSSAEIILDALELLPDKTLEEAVCRPRRKGRRYGGIGVVACLCLILVSLVCLRVKTSSDIPSPTEALSAGNFFTVKAYAMDEELDGSFELYEADLLDQQEALGARFVGNDLYVNIGLRYEGTNIQSVVFTTEDGFFAKQYIDSASDGDGISQLYIGGKLRAYGDKFEVIGNTVTLDSEAMTEDCLLFWGTEVIGNPLAKMQETIQFSAVATFYDGQTQEYPIAIDLSNVGGWVRHLSDAEMQEELAVQEYYSSLPLEKCELIEDSVREVKDNIYESSIGTSKSWGSIPDDAVFDENGFYIDGFVALPGSMSTYLVVYKRGADGTFTGMLYHVPDELRYNDAVG